MTIQAGQQKKVEYSTKRRQVVAAADVLIQQVQVVDSKGQIRSVLVWQCGPDILVAETMDGLFDENRRSRAPKWLVDQLKVLPPSRLFDCKGNAKGSVEELSADTAVTAAAPVPQGMEDDDAGGFEQA
jgi:hypothetical protein